MSLTITISQQPNGVFFSGSGTLNLSSLIGKTSSIWNSNPLSRVNAQNGYINGGLSNTNIKYYPNLFQILPFGIDNQTFYDGVEILNYQNNGNYFVIGQDVSVLNQPGIGIKPNYVSNSFISFSFLLANQTYDSLGTWPQGFARSWVGSTNVGESIFISVLPTTPNVNINIFESSNNVYADVSGQVSQNWNVDGNLYSFGPGNLLQSGPIASSRQIQFGSASVGFQSFPIYVYPPNFGNLFKVANTGSIFEPFRIDYQNVYTDQNNPNGLVSSSLTFTGVTVASMGLISGVYNWYGPGNHIRMTITGAPPSPTPTRCTASSTKPAYTIARSAPPKCPPSTIPRLLFT